MIGRWRGESVTVQTHSHYIRPISFLHSNPPPILLFLSLSFHSATHRHTHTHTIHVMDYIDFSQPTFYYVLANIFFNPLFWNTVARAGKQLDPQPTTLARADFHVNSN